MTRHDIANFLAACALCAGSLGFLSHAQAQSHYSLRMDCHGTNGIPSWSSTGSSVYLEFFVEGRWVFARPFDADAYGTGPVPSSLCDQEYELGGNVGSYMNIGMIQKIRIRTTGDDAFWVDRLKLTELSSGTWWEWGVNNSVGYCFSTDPADGNANCWNGAAYTSIEFTF